MTSLSALSADALGLVIDSSPFTVFLHLFLCGNHALNSKMSSSVTKIELVSGGALPISKFPRSVSSLRRLRHLTFSSTTEVVDTPLEWSDILKSLPPTLESLGLYFPQAFRHLFQSPSTQSDSPLIPWDNVN